MKTKHNHNTTKTIHNYNRKGDVAIPTYNYRCPFCGYTTTRQRPMEQRTDWVTCIKCGDKWDKIMCCDLIPSLTASRRDHIEGEDNG